MSSTLLSHDRVAVWELEFGARPQPDGSTKFRVWSPNAGSLSVKIFGEGERIVSMERVEQEVFEAIVPDTGAGADYKYIIDDEKERPDAVSRWQPHGVHGPSRIVDANKFKWTDAAWKGITLKDLIIYELHIGTFTPEGTFQAVIEKLSHLKSLGITAI